MGLPLAAYVIDCRVLTPVVSNWVIASNMGKELSNSLQ